jgi:hypothetical protein
MLIRAGNCPIDFRCPGGAARAGIFPVSIGHSSFRCREAQSIGLSLSAFEAANLLEIGSVSWN